MGRIQARFRQLGPGPKHCRPVLGVKDANLYEFSDTDSASFQAQDIYYSLSQFLSSCANIHLFRANSLMQQGQWSI